MCVSRLRCSPKIWWVCTKYFFCGSSSHCCRNFGDILSRNSFDRRCSPPFFPGKDQVVVLPAVTDTVLLDYLVAIGDIVTPKNILYASKISRNRICIYLNSKSWVNEVVNNHPNVDIKGYSIGLRRLLNPIHRIIISNICLSIPHSISIRTSDQNAWFCASVTNVFS